jgi:proteasome alpha subunit
MSRGREYDGAITIFSPEGRIYQVEYALELVKRGSPIVGIKSAEGVVLAVLEPQLSKLAAPTSSKKIFRIDDHVGVAIAGLSPDARVLIKQSRLFCQSNKMTYDEPADIEDLASAVGDLLQRYTQNAGVRPFGVSLLFGGVDDYRVSLIGTDPSGSYRGYRATSVGRNSEKALAVLKEEYRQEITLDEAMALSVQALKEASENDLSADGMNIAVVTKESKKFRSLSVQEIQKYL